MPKIAVIKIRYTGYSWFKFIEDEKDLDELINYLWKKYVRPKHDKLSKLWNLHGIHWIDEVSGFCHNHGLYMEDDGYNCFEVLNGIEQLAFYRYCKHNGLTLEEK